MLPDRYGFHQVQLHNENVRNDYRYANGTSRRRVTWREASEPLVPSGGHITHSIGSVIAAFRMRIRHQPIVLVDHAIETTKGS